MIKVALADEDGISKTCLVSETETPKNILKYFKVNPDLRTIYMNGEMLSKENIEKPVPRTSVVHIKIEERSVIKGFRF